jgi:hypothetical protein
LTLKFVKLSHIVQISGKILIANNKNMVGATKIQAIERSDKPFILLEMLGGVALTILSIALLDIKNS